jgi:hydroxymethylbilane synthase
MTTLGDRVLGTSLPKIGEKSLFTKDLEDALEHGGVDFVVHSLKDLPTQLPFGMTIGAILEREDPRDALVLNNKFIGNNLKSLPKGSLIGTSSLRRAAQLARYYSHLKICDIRGNLNTRLAKLDAPQSSFAGIILANAGLTRMGWMKRVDQVIEPEELLYAVGQGALAVECRANDAFVLNLLSKLCDLKSQCRILVERSFLKTLGGGCSAPVAVNSVLSEIPNSVNSEHVLDVDGAVWSLNGDTEIKDKVSTNLILDVGDTKSPGVPKKRQKISDGDKSPEVIDENPFKADIEDLVSIHGKICPTTSKKCSGTCDSSAKTDKTFDLTNVPVGQDFMGSCPVLNTQQKVSFSSDCNEGGDDPCAKCPFAEQALDEFPKEMIEKCPYLRQKNQKPVEMIDYEAVNEAKTEVTEKKSLIAGFKEIKLYCGLFCHTESIRPLLEKCEQLGIELANKLIDADALTIMKAAQDEIHAKA